MKEEVNNLSQQKHKLFAEIDGYPKLASALAKLLDIFYRMNNNNNNNFEELDLLVDQVRMAGGIKAAKQKLSSQPIVITLAALASDSSVLLSNYNNNNNNDGEIESSNSKSPETEERQELPVQNNFNNDPMQNAEGIGPKKCHENTRALNHTSSLNFFSFIASFSILIMLSLSARNRAVERLKENGQDNDDDDDDANIP